LASSADSGSSSSGTCGSLVSGDVTVKVDRPSAEAAALQPGSSVQVSLPGAPVLVDARR
jgi:hypothetical protein